MVWKRRQAEVTPDHKDACQGKADEQTSAPLDRAYGFLAELAGEKPYGHTQADEYRQGDA